MSQLQSGAGAGAGRGLQFGAGGAGSDIFGQAAASEGGAGFDDFLERLSAFLVSGGFGSPNRRKLRRNLQPRRAKALGIRSSGKTVNRLRLSTPNERAAKRDKRRTAFRASLDRQRAAKAERKKELEAERLRKLRERLAESRRRQLTTDIRSPLDKIGGIGASEVPIA